MILRFACGAEFESRAGVVPDDICVWTNQPGMKIDRPYRWASIPNVLAPPGDYAPCLFGCPFPSSESGRRQYRCIADDGSPYFVVTCRPVRDRAQSTQGGGA